MNQHGPDNIYYPKNRKKEFGAGIFSTKDRGRWSAWYAAAVRSDVEMAINASDDGLWNQDRRAGGFVAQRPEVRSVR